MKKPVILILLVVTAAGFLLFAPKTHENGQKIGWGTIKIDGVELNVEIADRPEQRALGLSGRASLRENEGMLFVFEKEGDYGFWMKDMNFPIDIIWIDKERRIVGAEPDVSPDTYPKTFFPPTQVLYVLETPSGFLAENNIQIGAEVAF